MISWKVLLVASIVTLFSTGASSHIMNTACQISARLLSFDIWHIVDSFVYNKLLNLEWAVQSSDIIKTANLEVTVASAIIPCNLISASNVQYRNILPGLPGPSTKKTPHFLLFTLSSMSHRFAFNHDLYNVRLECLHFVFQLIFQLMCPLC